MTAAEIKETLVAVKPGANNVLVREESFGKWEGFVNAIDEYYAEVREALGLERAARATQTGSP